MIAIVQRILRAAFMAAEAVFNRAFGDRMNPYYHLGKITFYLFWIVAGTGLILYAFFDTSVDGAYRSVEAITHGAWGLGGLMRSLHRYASDAMVLSMLLHMLRYFAFDRLRGFRAFSWVTGVALLWLTYVSGVNGFMLPWDRLAQFVTQTSFEWLDWLPGFQGRLIRNFILPEHVTNRLFSLLVFMHIGVPLVLLLMMWVHVQRVPKAAMTPPKPITIALSLTLILLSLVVPVLSQGPADLHSEPLELTFDWFLLPVFALVGSMPLGLLWGLTVGLTALGIILPWLTLRRGSRASHQLNFHPGPALATARAGETLLDAGLRADLALPYDCRSGGCGVCVCTVLNGKVDLGNYQEAALTPAMRARGQALMCCAVALEDVEIEVEGVTSLAKEDAQALRRVKARVQTLEPLAPTVMRVVLALLDGGPLKFTAGQYVNIILEDGAKRAFSFANAPADPAQPFPLPTDNLVELHVRLIEGGRFTTHVFEQMKVGDVLELEGPIGRFTLRESERPILMIAGATGFAPIKSILEDAFRRGIQRPIALYWGVRQQDDLYMQDLLARWQQQHANFQYIPVLSDIADDDPWTGRRGFVHESLLADHPDLTGYEVYACGSTRMVEAAVPDFIAHGLGEQFCFSDAFVPSAPTPATTPPA
ncbi:MAG TPA: cytochrome b N-terminal domain-containing protein [Ottowia sp.]|uniref:2Fe-2S iron-sulfur cluster-binding protein n=1 Tax=Ottowia sp. TaxID=1898956 RepID=UPI002BB3432F|nr:2Fe-2S iron-sulfur cluster-binding protein [Ottowia sp.]HMN20440.1 cytochrome b N-terminal domain-containing protein [Ottowia sp.]